MADSMVLNSEPYTSNGLSQQKTWKVCLVIHSMGIGGMERVMAQLANNFAERANVEVHLILIGRDREVLYSLSAEVNIHKPDFRFNNHYRLISALRTMLFLRTKAKSIKPDVILSFGELWNNLVLLALKGMHIPVYVSDRSKPGKDLGKLHNYLRTKLYPNAKGYIAQSKKAAEICRNNGWNTNIRVIGNPIRAIKSNGSVSRENIILSVGRLIDTKHFDQLIKMFVEIDCPGWQLMIVGGDAKKQKGKKVLQNLVKELDAEDRVLLAGERKDVEAFYRRSKIFAFTSSSEGFPNVIGEALSAGLPVVAYDCMAGPSEMISDGVNGFLIHLYHQEEFKKKLKLLLSDESLRQEMSQRCKTSVHKFNPDDISEEFFRFITQQNAIGKEIEVMI